MRGVRRSALGVRGMRDGKALCVMRYAFGNAGTEARDEMRSAFGNAGTEGRSAFGSVAHRPQVVSV
jgi:hypothetical protein